MKLEFSKNTQISSFMQICPVGAELFHADRRDKANSRFSQFCEMPKNLKHAARQRTKKVKS